MRKTFIFMICLIIVAIGAIVFSAIMSKPLPPHESQVQVEPVIPYNNYSNNYISSSTQRIETPQQRCIRFIDYHNQLTKDMQIKKYPDETFLDSMIIIASACHGVDMSVIRRLCPDCADFLENKPMINPQVYENAHGKG